MNKDSGLSRVCVDLCGGRCCEPWWGIIIYSMTKRDGLSRLSDFKREVVRGIASRAERITSRYITNETPPRLLFGMPDRYNVTVEKVEVANGSLRIELRAMFAFRCLFLSPGGECLIHPSKVGEDIRPPPTVPGSVPPISRPMRRGIAGLSTRRSGQKWMRVKSLTR